MATKLEIARGILDQMEKASGPDPSRTIDEAWIEAGNEGIKIGERVYYPNSPEDADAKPMFERNADGCGPDCYYEDGMWWCP